MSTNKRDDIMKAALELFAERGFDGTTVPTIAEKAKVGAGTIYRYFENKEVLVNSLFQEVMEQLSNQLLTNQPLADVPIREQFRHIVSQVVEFANHHDRALAFIDSHANAPFLDQASRDTFEHFLGFIRGILDEGKRQGVICPLPSDALIAIVYGALVRLLMFMKKGIVENSSELLNQAEACCWNAIRVH